MIIGHEKNLIFLEKALENQSLSHAYCFVGPDSVGKRALACHMASKVLKVNTDKLPAHPDFFYLAREVNEKKGRLKKDISVAQAKQVRNFLQNRSWCEKGTRITVIDEAELLNKEAANALLKTIEETSENSLMFLLTMDDQALPATVRSRCQVMNFDLVLNDKILSGLKEKGFSGKRAEEAAAMAWGRPGRALQLLTEPDLLSEYRNEFERWQKLFKQPFNIKLKNTEDLFNDKDPIRSKDRLKKILDIWMMLWRESMLHRFSEGDSRRFKRIFPLEQPVEMSSNQILEIIDDLRAAKIFLNRNVNPRLLLEQVLLKF